VLALKQRLQGLLNQAIIAQGDVEGKFVMRRVHSCKRTRTRLSVEITRFVTAWMLSLPQAVSASPGSPPFRPLSMARSAVVQTSASTRGRRGVTSTSTSLALPHSPLPTCCSLCLVGPPRALPKTSRLAMLSCCRVSSRLWPSKPSLLKHLEGCVLMR
jgi:hypothetical protein